MILVNVDPVRVRLVRLVRLGEPQLLCQDTCRSMGLDIEAAWTREELLANRADLLKAKLFEAASRCAEELARKLPG